MIIIMIEVNGLTKSYGGNRGIDDITFSIPEGQIVGFLGPNGAGKTTTMNIITGYLSSDSGTVKIAGFNILENPIEARRHIGYLPEQPPLYLPMTVKEYLEFAYELKGLKKADCQKHIKRICEMTGLTNVFGRMIGHLSKGYRQRIGLAQAMLGEPDVLILDEPTIGLDPRQIVEIRNVIHEIGKRRTVILSTHILTEASAVCERVLVIANGRIVADDKPDNLIGSVAGGRALVARIAGNMNSVHALLRNLDGVMSVEPVGEMETDSYDFVIEGKQGIDIRKPLFSALADAGYPLLLLRPQSSSLEDVFLKLTDEVNKTKTGKRRKKTTKKESPESEGIMGKETSEKEIPVKEGEEE